MRLRGVVLPLVVAIFSLGLSALMRQYREHAVAVTVICLAWAAFRLFRPAASTQ